MLAYPAIPLARLVYSFHFSSLSATCMNGVKSPFDPISRVCNKLDLVMIAAYAIPLCR